MMLQTNNYGEIFHNHRNCRDMRTDGTCRTIRHETACFKKRCQDTKRNYREEVKKVLKQNPSSKNKEILQIVNTNFNLIMDENGQRQPCGLFKALGINLVKEKARDKSCQCMREISRRTQFEQITWINGYFGN